MIPEIKIESWKHFKDECEQLFSFSKRNWLFRGQQIAGWPLTTSIERLRLSNLRSAEATMLETVKRNIHYYTNPPGDLSDAFQRLALLQHYGAPTRLLDVTQSPYVAAFFAMEKCIEEPCAVYAFQHHLILQNSIDLLLKEAKDMEQEIDGVHRDIRQEPFFTKFFYERNNQLPNVYSTQPYYFFDRLKSQMGGFLVQGDLQQSFEQNLEALTSFSNQPRLVIKFILPANIRLEGLLDLQRMNITNETLFPGIEGFMRSLSLTYVLERFGMGVEI
jgi:hypothetical protein